MDTASVAIVQGYLEQVQAALAEGRKEDAEEHFKTAFNAMANLMQLLTPITFPVQVSYDDPVPVFEFDESMVARFEETLQSLIKLNYVREAFVFPEQHPKIILAHIQEAARRKRVKRRLKIRFVGRIFLFYLERRR